MIVSTVKFTCVIQFVRQGLKIFKPVHRLSFQINAVRAVVPNKSNNEIVLVLQHFENCVDKAVQAFLEGKTI